MIQLLHLCLLIFPSCVWNCDWKSIRRDASCPWVHIYFFILLEQIKTVPIGSAGNFGDSIVVSLFVDLSILELLRHHPLYYEMDFDFLNYREGDLYLGL